MDLCRRGLSLGLFALLLGGAGHVCGQITATETSRDFLAIQCAASAGTNAENFREYGAKLAVTLSTLNPAQQERVFGYLPTPGATTTPATATVGTGAMAGGEPPEEEANDPGFLGGLIDRTSEALGEVLIPDTEPGAVIAGTPPLTEPVDPDPVNQVNDPVDPGVTDPVEPGQEEQVPPGQALKTDPDGDGNNGHGNSGGFDPSNPGNGGQIGGSDPTSKGSNNPEATEQNSSGSGWVPPGQAKKGVTEWNPGNGEKSNLSGGSTTSEGTDSNNSGSGWVPPGQAKKGVTEWNPGNGNGGKK